MLTTSNSSNLPARFAAVVAVVTCLATSAPASAAAQTPQGPQSPQGDARWQPFLGCWTPYLGRPGVFSQPDAQQVCVVPAAGDSAVDVITVNASRIVSREHIDANGEHRASGRDGCAGWESAEWSSDARRVYLKAEYECPGGLKRATTGMMATSANGDWIDIVGVALRDNMGVRALRHHLSEPPDTLPADIASAVERGSRAGAAIRLAGAALPIGNREIIDASRHVNAAVVQAWLAESRQAFTVDAARLVALADAGVDARVIDMVVALSYPLAFGIKPSPSTVGALAPRSGGGGGRSDLIGLGTFLDCGPYTSGLSLYGWDGCSPYGLAYGYAGYDNFYGYGGGWYDGGPPVIIVRPESHGQVVNGRGYSAGKGDSGSTASSSSGASSSSASSGSSSSSGSSGSSGSSSGGSSASSGGGERTAVPR